MNPWAARLKLLRRGADRKIRRTTPWLLVNGKYPERVEEFLVKEYGIRKYTVSERNSAMRAIWAELSGEAQDELSRESEEKLQGKREENARGNNLEPCTDPGEREE